MKFLKIYAAILVVCFIFAFFGGWMLFDFSINYYVTTAVYAFVITVVLTIFLSQEEKIEQLEERVRKLEEKQ